ncbi:hypothetical protein AB6A23_12145 [Paenibacillus tarimensis]
MSEKNILAFFNSPEQAEKALSQIKPLRLIDSSIDRVDGYPGDGVEEISNPVTSDFPGLGYLTLGGDFTDRNAGILAASSVSASGMSSGGPDNRVTGKDVLLTLVIDEADFDKAMEIVRNEGAEV